MKNENKEALKSSVLVCAAFAAFLYGITLLTNPPMAWISGIVGGLSGLLLGLMTTWYPEE